MREDWDTAISGEILDVRDGTHDTPKYIEEPVHPLVTSKNLKNGVIDLSNVKYISQDSFLEINKRSKVDIGDVLFAMIGTIGNPVVITKEPNYSIKNVGLFKNIHNVIDSKLLGYFLDSVTFYSQLERRQFLKGTTQKFIPLGHLRKLEIPLAPLPEQRAIVAKIEELFVCLDKGIADLRKAQDQLKIYRQAVLKKAFEGELTKDWREQQTDLPTADELLEQIKAERQKHYEQQIENWKQAVKVWEANGKEGKKPNRPTKIKETIVLDVEETNEFDYIPENWFILEMQGIADKITDGTHHTPTYTDDGVKFISVKDIYSEQVHFDNCKYISQDEHKQLIKRCHPESGDILITKSGTIGRMAIVPDIEFSLFVSVALMKVQSTKHLFHSKWIYYAVKFHLMGLNIDQDIKGGLLKNYHLEDLRLAKLIMVPLLEQHQIVQEIESRLSVCDKLEESITAALEKAKALRQSILKKAFEGTLLSSDEIAACKAAPDYEPASVLLARIEQSRNEKIKAETLRQAQSKKKKK